jgi:hypothetical protein
MVLSMLMLILQIILVGLVIHAIVRGILLSRRLSKIEHHIEYQSLQLLGVLRKVESLSLSTGRLDKEVKAIQDSSGRQGPR